MNDPSVAPHAILRQGFRPFLATTIVVYVTFFALQQSSLSPLQALILLTAGGAYLLAGVWGARLYESTASPVVLAMLYGVEILLGGLIVYVMAAFFLAGLILIPLAGLSVWILPRPWVWTVGALLTGALGLAYGLRGGLEAGLLAAAGYLAAIVFVVYVTGIAVQEQRTRLRVEQLANELEAANRQLRDYAAQAEELVIARERARLAHEIHDSVGHCLTALDFQLELLRQLPPDRLAQRQQVLEQCHGLVKDGLADVRRAVRALPPSILETFSLPEAIAGLIADFDRGRRTPTDWQVSDQAKILPPRLTLPLYRAVQEALTNIQRHAASAPEVQVHLGYAPHEVTLTVENTRPITTADEPAPIHGGHGLLGLRERAEAVGGAFHAGPTADGGFQVVMRLPTP